MHFCVLSTRISYWGFKREDSMKQPWSVPGAVAGAFRGEDGRSALPQLGPHPGEAVGFEEAMGILTALVAEGLGVDVEWVIMEPRPLGSHKEPFWRDV